MTHEKERTRAARPTLGWPRAQGDLAAIPRSRRRPTEVHNVRSDRLGGTSEPAPRLSGTTPLTLPRGGTLSFLDVQEDREEGFPVSIVTSQRTSRRCDGIARDPPTFTRGRRGPGREGAEAPSGVRRGVRAARARRVRASPRTRAGAELVRGPSAAAARHTTLGAEGPSGPLPPFPPSGTGAVCELSQERNLFTSGRLEHAPGCRSSPRRGGFVETLQAIPSTRVFEPTSG